MLSNNNIIEDEPIDLREESFYKFSFGASALSHILILVISFILTEQFTTQLPANFQSLQFEVEKLQAQSKKIDTEELEEKKEIPIEPKKDVGGEKEISNDFAATFSSNILNADTSALLQVYSESTRNVRVRYPLGWQYVDQNVKKKLDGITFFGSGNSSAPPPYIHIEVKEKYLFNPKRFLFNVKMNDFVAHFNEPTVLEDQYSQVLYLRTDTDEDYSIKLIVNGRERFYEYQKVFFSMVKTFKFGGLF